MWILIGSDKKRRLGARQDVTGITMLLILHRSFASRRDRPKTPRANPEDPDACNVYKDLKFPPEVYEHIAGYYEGKVESGHNTTA